MSYLLHFTGPSFEQTITLKPKTPAVVVGRDPEAAVYLPDTERLISRRHLSIDWCEEGARIQVLSANGINTDRGDYFSGDEVVLGDGESGRLGPFSLVVEALSDAGDATSFAGMGSRPVPVGPVTRSAAPEPAPAKDPWADLLQEWSGDAPAPTPTAAPRVVQPVDDPFSSSTSWRIDDPGAFGSTSAFTASGAFAQVHPDAPVAASVQQPAASPAPSTPERLALQSLCRGLGVELPAGQVNFDWERFGIQVREVVECLGEHLATRVAARRDLKAEDRTMIGSKVANPLKTGMQTKELLQYLLLMPDGTGGFVPSRQALAEASAEAKAHEAAVRVAARSLAEGAIKDFDPARLRTSLLKGKLSIASVVDTARLWDLYTGFYEKNGERMPQWVDHLFNRHYMAGYLREMERLRRAAQPVPPQRDH
ncbi:type VI secretion system-associated FHA domain protein [Ramlibacter algicola]|uniref:FHA domain-containing protein n=1 Tax=Ramlibacter algicola TaxID=2795217 RepID=A0A934Q2A7_9BURK|nr:FHA domain-containing protein [Ramlibacter algicola]